MTLTDLIKMFTEPTFFTGLVTGALMGGGWVRRKVDTVAGNAYNDETDNET